MYGQCVLGGSSGRAHCFHRPCCGLEFDDSILRYRCRRFDHCWIYSERLGCNGQHHGSNSHQSEWNVSKLHAHAGTRATASAAHGIAHGINMQPLDAGVARLSCVHGHPFGRGSEHRVDRIPRGKSSLAYRAYLGNGTCRVEQRTVFRSGR